MKIKAYWDYDCAGWFCDIGDTPIRLSTKIMNSFVDEDFTGNELFIEVSINSEVIGTTSICKITPIKVA